MRSILASAVALFAATAAHGQTFYTPAVTQKPMAGTYSTGWHYGRVTFKVVSYTGAETSAPEKRAQWYNVLFEKAFGSQQPGGTFIITLDLCDSTGCAKPVAKKLIAAFKKTANQPVKQADFFTAAGTALTNFFTSGTEAEPIAGATVEQAFITNGDDLIQNHLIGEPKDNNFTVRLTIASIDEVFVTKGILPEIFTILNSTANDPIAKAALEAVPIASSIPTLTQAATNIAEKLLAQPSYVKSITNDQPIQFVNPDPFPRFVQYNIPARTDSSADCNKPAAQRKNCILLQIDANTTRSIVGTFDIQTGKFKSPDARGYRAAASKLMKKEIDEYVGSGSEQLKKFVNATSVGTYNDSNLGSMCGGMLDMLYKVFTRWDARALYWAYLTVNWEKLKANSAVSGCLLTDQERQEMMTIGLPLPTVPGGT